MTGWLTNRVLINVPEHYFASAEQAAAFRAGEKSILRTKPVCSEEAIIVHDERAYTNRVGRVP